MALGLPIILEEEHLLLFVIIKMASFMVSIKLLIEEGG